LQTIMSDAIHQELEFDATPDRIYEAYMDAAQHSAFTDGPAQISRDEGGAFSCHGGGIVGRTLELVPGARIVQAWRVASWEPGLYSVVRLELRPEGGRTRLVMDHSGVPSQFREHISSGWHARYWVPLAKFLAA
jgi:activator of HSP90 ATPase